MNECRRVTRLHFEIVSSRVFLKKHVLPVGWRLGKIDVEEYSNVGGRSIAERCEPYFLVLQMKALCTVMSFLLVRNA